ncbi:uncharacterized protein LOC115397341 [Salarias fasciatus]|uniref:uncharacterized protein LOC115397341 n=1 Tax=Salarias fasciatus TaxID=181472 RepID=UPI001176D206|nr:uncharacterized protein LOC115397341 [Salarias fasciatus]
MKELRSASHISLLLLVVLRLSTPSSAQGAPAAAVYRTRPVNVTAALGESAVFRCGVVKRSPNVTLSYGNYSLTCPGEDVEYIPQALYGTCETPAEQFVAVWTVKGTSYSDNGTRVVCEQPLDSSRLIAVLHVVDNGVSYFVLVGCTIGGFFGILLVFGLFFIMLQRSETLQKCFRGKEPEEDMVTVVTREEKEEKPEKKI